jgi:hypothetical protein
MYHMFLLTKTYVLTNVLDFGFSYVPSSPKDINCHRENNELLLLLRSQLAEAINLQNKESIAQLHEAIRCVKLFDSRGVT